MYPGGKPQFTNVNTPGGTGKIFIFYALTFVNPHVKILKK